MTVNTWLRQVGYSGSRTRDSAEAWANRRQRSPNRAKKCATGLNRPETALNKCRTAVDKPEDAVNKLGDAVNEPEDAVNKLEDALNKSEDAVKKLRDAVNKPEDAVNKPEDAVNKLEDAVNKSEDAVNKLETAVNKCRTTVNKSRTALEKCRTAGKNSRTAVQAAGPPFGSPEPGAGVPDCRQAAAARIRQSPSRATRAGTCRRSQGVDPARCGASADDASTSSDTPGVLCALVAIRLRGLRGRVRLEMADNRRRSTTPFSRGSDMSRSWVVLCLSLCVAAPLNAQAPQPAPPGDIVGVGNFAHIVADLDRSVGFYRDVLGLKVTGNIPFAPNDAVAKFGHTEGGQSRVAVLQVPGLAMGIELIEYKDIERKPQHPHFVDPGAANMAMRVRDLDTLFPKIQTYPGVNILTAGGKPVTLTTPNGTLHAVFVQDPDGFVVEMIDGGANATADANAGPVIAGSAFEATVRDSSQTVKFYNELLGFNFMLGAAFNDNQQMAATAGAPGSSFRQSRAQIPGTSVPFTLIEFKRSDRKELQFKISERKELSGRTQDPGTTVLQLIVRDVTALTAKLKAAGVPIVTTGGMPVQVSPALKIAIVKDPNNMLLELAERASR
jgi:catechol 2,3-dioxygenase-like lactoylglutathione lyase family enzyme